MKFNVIRHFLVQEKPLHIDQEAAVHRQLILAVGVKILKIFSLMLVVQA
jgi:hypothetical protein